MSAAPVKKVGKIQKAKKLGTRSLLRFAPDPGTFAAIDMSLDLDVKFAPQHFALVFSESFSGCGLIVYNNRGIKEGSQFRIQVGQLTPMLAEVKWRKDLDKEVARVGCVYIEE
jgi:hypothetical protein